MALSLAYCEQDTAGGFLWPSLQENRIYEQPCNLVSDFFRRETKAYRRCLDTGFWGEPDMSTCTLKENAEPFLLISFILEGNDTSGSVDDEVRTPGLDGFADDGTPDEQTELRLEIEMQEQLNMFRIQFQSVRLQAAYVASVSLSFEVILLSSQPSSEQMSGISDYTSFFSSSFSTFAGFDVQAGNRGATVVTGADSCPCSPSVAMGDEVSPSLSQLTLCVGVPSSPCNCSITNVCQCVSPFVGDGVSCTVDTDLDGYPDRPLLPPRCRSQTRSYCIQDNCPLVFNVDQDPFACQPSTGGEEFDGCPFGTDPVWEILWANTPRDTTNIQRCPGGFESIGNATRYCDNEGEWSDPDVLSCDSVEFSNILAQATEAFASTNAEVLLAQSGIITSQLADATSGRTISILPSDIQTTNSILSNVINILEGNVDGMSNYEESLDENIINVFSNVLDVTHTNGWNALQNTSRSVRMDGSELLLNSAERYGLVIAKSLEVSAPPRRLSRPNIVMSASQYDASVDMAAKNFTFPMEEDLVNYTSKLNPIVAEIPTEFVAERLRELSSETTAPAIVPVVNVLFNNLESFLPPSFLESSSAQGGASVVYSIQVGERSLTTGQSQALEESPISLKFTFSEFENASKYTCAFWNFSEPIGSGSFITDGVDTNSNNTEGNVTNVHCLSKHATSFAVLVNVAGGLTGASADELKALQIVSYIGCAISIICLGITVIFFLTQRKKLFKSVNYFVHLNLAISLLLAYIVFVLGIELGNSTTGGCIFVALLLHYLFLSAFCWMLCEGIVLYLLLVVVFSRVIHHWWLFVLIGYLTPIPIVVISVASRHEYYGVRDVNGNLQYCWLSVEQGTIYAFVVPILCIIVINVVFLVLGLNSLWKNQRKRHSRNSKKNENKNLDIAKSLIVASIILLPLLGLTWVFGLLTINANSTVFAWLFTIFNSLQGAAIFFFHVVRNDTVWSKITPRFSTLWRKSTTDKWSSQSTENSVKYGTYKRSSNQYTTSTTGGYSMNTLNKSGTLMKADSSPKSDKKESIAEETKIDLGNVTNEVLENTNTTEENVPMEMLENTSAEETIKIDLENVPKEVTENKTEEAKGDLLTEVPKSTTSEENSEVVIVNGLLANEDDVSKETKIDLEPSSTEPEEPVAMVNSPSDEKDVRSGGEESGLKHETENQDLVSDRDTVFVNPVALVGDNTEHADDKESFTKSYCGKSNKNELDTDAIDSCSGECTKV